MEVYKTRIAASQNLERAIREKATTQKDHAEIVPHGENFVIAVFTRKDGKEEFVGFY